MGTALVVFMVYTPYLYYRYALEHTKRLRPITDGRVYRSGCLTADGFREFIVKNKIKTVINLMEENPDPVLHANRFSRSETKESTLCKELGVTFKFLYVELLPEDQTGKVKPKAIDEFFQIMDYEKAYPVLLHCKAGLHRTGVLSAVYRMEYEGWSREDAMRELRSHGFGHFIANKSNPYIAQYVLPYQPRSKSLPGREVPGALMLRTK